MRFAILLALAACIGWGSPAFAATFTVDSTFDAVDTVPGDGFCADNTGACTLRAAVMETNALLGADVVNLPAGTYVLSIPGTGENEGATGDLNVTDALTVLGSGRSTTIIDADRIDRVLSVVGADLSVHSLTVTGGLAGASDGGGILCVGCGLVVTDSAVSGNLAEGSGGFLWPNGSGGGVMVLGAATIASTTISGNQAEGDGGGVMVVGELTILESAIFGNSADSNGGGVSNSAGAVTLVNSTVSGNVGAGVASWCRGIKPCSGGYTEVIGSTISGNSGGGIRDVWGGHLHYLFGLQNSVIAEQASGSDCPSQGVGSAGHNIDSDGSCGLGGPTDLPNTNPMLGPLQDNGGPTLTHALLPGSPAIDAIPPADCTWDDDGDPFTPEVPLTEDQRGISRPRGLGCDIGSFERAPSTPGASCGLGPELVLLTPLLMLAHGRRRRRGFQQPGASAP